MKTSMERLVGRLRPVSSLGPIVITLLLLSQMPAAAGQIVVKHAQGETVLADVPKTVVTLDLAALETLDVLGVRVAGAPSTHIPAHLSKYKDDVYAKIGTLFEPDYEAIHAAKPDLIIVGARSAVKYADLAKIAPTIDLSTDDKDYLASALRNVRTLGLIFGKEAEVERRIAALDASIATLRQQATHAGRGLIILTTGGRMSAYGPNSRFGALHRDFGIEPAVGDLTTAVHGQGVSFELILKANPDWLFVVDRDAGVGTAGQPAAQLLDNPLVTHTTAWRKGHVVYLEPVGWYLVGGGLASLQASVDQIATALAAKP